MQNCPNGHGPLLRRDNDFYCPKCCYTFSAPKKKGNKYVEEVNQTIRGLWMEAKIGGDSGERKPLFTVLDKRNYDSGHCYRGINRWLTALYPDIAFITKNSIEKHGLTLPDNAERLTVVAWVIPKLTKAEKKLPQDKQDEILRRKRPFMVTHSVYPANSVPELEPKEFPEDKNIKKFESIDAFVESIGAKVVEGGNKSYYNWDEDTIYIPRHQQFETEEDYYRELFRMVALSAGHESRLNADEKKYQRGQKYGRESLVVEFASSYICNRFGIEPDEKVIQEVDHWFIALDSDPHLMVCAAQQAEKVLDYYFKQ
jgi:antirestriction protein ArdC